ncbi:MAG: DUF5686 and carboxypeptidase regulatory-like domain-containing protein [Bacteroidia bacterium]
MISGKITDEQNQPVPFANVYIENTTVGTIANPDGLYSLDVPQGKCLLVFKMIGYKMQVETLAVNQNPIKLNVQLHIEKTELQAVTISGSGEDPAYRVMRQVIKKRKFYLDQVNSYSCDVYIKGLQRILKHPDKIMGYKVDPGGDIDSTSGIFYLSESVSKFNFEQPDKIREKMISSKVSGDNKAFSYNQASDMLLNFYENVLQIPMLSTRGFISPIAGDAFLNYRYKMLGSFLENGLMIDKILVIPKYPHAPLFSGVIYIVEDQWRIHSLDLELTKENQLRFLDTFKIKQTFLPVNADVWMPFSNKISFDFSIFGIKGNGVYLGVNSNYQLNPVFPKHFFNGEELDVSDSANKKDSTYWSRVRPVTLTKQEKKDYHQRDSLMTKRTSKAYLDSVDRINNKFSPADLIFGYTNQHQYEKYEFNFSPFIKNIAFNTVQGWNLALNTSYYKYNEDTHKSDRFTMHFGYGFSDKKLLLGAEWKHVYLPVKFGEFTLKAGKSDNQFNENEPISTLVNSVYSLFDKTNYMKLYQKEYVQAHHQIELFNGFLFYTDVEFVDRSPLLNTTDFSIYQNKHFYTSNDPQNAENFSNSFSENKIFDIDLGFQFSFKQRYLMRPNEKIILRSKFPVLKVSYKKAIESVFNSTANYDLLKAELTGRINLKMLGHSIYNVSVGKFLNSENVSFMDYQHFNGNQTLISNFDINTFDLLNYYTYSTKNYFLQGAFEQNFGGFILNKIPLIRELKFQEIASVKVLTDDQLHRYTEFSVGVKKLFFRAEFVTSFSDNQKLNSGFRFGLLF